MGEIDREQKHLPVLVAQDVQNGIFPPECAIAPMNGINQFNVYHFLSQTCYPCLKTPPRARKTLENGQSFHDLDGWVKLGTASEETPSLEKGPLWGEGGSNSNAVAELHKGAEDSNSNVEVADSNAAEKGDLLSEVEDVHFE